MPAKAIRTVVWKKGRWRPSRVSSWWPKKKARLWVWHRSMRLLLHRQPRQGIYAVRFEFFGRRPALDVPKPNYRRVRMKKVVVGGTPDDGGLSHLAPMESNIFSKHHALVAHCACTRYEDGSLRAPGEFKISSQGSSWKIQVVDFDSKAFFVAIGPTLDDCLALAVVLLESCSAPWEPAKWLHAAAKKK